MHARLLVLLVAAALCRPAAAQIIIDTFETGSISLSVDNDTVTGWSTVSSPGHCIAPVRTVTLTSYVEGAGPATLDVNAWTTADDSLSLAHGNYGGECRVEYVPGAPVNLSLAGTNDRVRVFWNYTTVNALLIMKLWDDAGGFAEDSLRNTVGDKGEFFFASYQPGVDLSRVTKIEFVSPDTIARHINIAEIRVMRSGASPLEFDAPVAGGAGPPYPVAPVTFDVTDDGGLVEHAQFTLVDAVSLASTASLPIRIQGFDGGGDVGIPGTAGQVLVNWDGGGAYEDTGFELQVDTSQVSGSIPARSSRRSP